MRVARRLSVVTVGQEIDDALKCMPMCRKFRACDGRSKGDLVSRLRLPINCCQMMLRAWSLDRAPILG